MPDLVSSQEMASRPICHIVTPVGNMGYGFDEAVTARELALLVPTGVPTAIILDSGSTDSGPEKLALGGMTCPRSAYVKDLTKLLRLVHTFRVPLIFSSAGGDGSDEHVSLMGEICQEIVAAEGNEAYSFKTISIFSGIDKTIIRKRLASGRITGCGPCVPALTAADIDPTPRIVAQVGPEPFVDVMGSDPDFDILIGGRAYDPAPYVAFCVFQLERQYPNLTPADIQSRHGGFLHMGKIMECGGLCSTPKSHGAVATVYASGVFDVRPSAPEARCTTLSVAAHTLYENTRPDVLRGPGGALHLLDARYLQLGDGRTVRVNGSRYQSSISEGFPYQFKLEGARVVGYRSMFLGSVRDYILIGQLDELISRVKKYVESQHSDTLGEWNLDFHVYGKGHSTPSGPGEVFVVAEAIAPTQHLATSLASKARVGMIHGSYEGQKATAGNFAFGIGGKMEIELGPCAQFSVYHLMELDSGEESLGSTATEVGLERPGKLIRASVAILGKGKRLPSDDAFKATVTLLQDTYPPQPSPPIPEKTMVEVKRQTRPTTLSDVTRILRSKNAGPFEITLDAMFHSEEAYYAIKKSDLLSPGNVAKALGIAEEDIIWSGFFDPALAFKVTIPRKRGGRKAAAGSFMENDVHGSQQHVGLANIKLPSALGGFSGYGLLGWGTWRWAVGAVGTFVGAGGFVIGKYLSSRHRRG